MRQDIISRENVEGINYINVCIFQYEDWGIGCSYMPCNTEQVSHTEW
jgi:hypothetical protein